VRSAMRRLLVLSVLALAAAPAAFAESYHHGRVRYVEDGVSIQRATETGAEEATANLPFLPGDRVWTDASGRAEFQFAAGSLIRLDSGSKLDYVSHDDARDERVVLRLWSGAVFLHLRDRRDGTFEIETPGGIVSAGNRGAVRIDVQAGETRVSVYEGEAGLEAGESVRVRTGERVYARRGEISDGPASFDRTEGDEFADWDGGRQEQTAYAANRPGPLPDDIATYGDELDRHGAWYYETEVGHVWRPYVSADWQPYSDGRWVWTAYGWTWVPYESWGWATSHYGRWGFNSSLGWYWIPGATWAPAWVSWAVGGDYVGWCPLGYRDRAVLVYDRLGRGARGGVGIPRGSTVAQTPWTYLRRGDIGARDLSRRRIQLDERTVQQVRLVDSPHARLTRDFAVTETPAGAPRAVPRNASTRPGISDTVPELRGDPMTTIPIARRRGRPIDDAERASSPDTGSARSGGSATPRTAHPTDVRSGQRAGEVEARTPDRPVRERDGSQADREVLRPMFRPLSRTRPDGQDGGVPSDATRSRPEGEARSRNDGEARPRGEGEARPRGEAEGRPRGESEARPRGDGEARRGGDGESRHGGGEAHSGGSGHESNPRPSAPPPRSQSQSQSESRHEGRPSGSARRPHGQ
jgi:FecR protein